MISEAEFKESNSGSDETEKKIEDELKRQEMRETLERIIVIFFYSCCNYGGNNKEVYLPEKKMVECKSYCKLGRNAGSQEGNL